VVLPACQMAVLSTLPHSRASRSIRALAFAHLDDVPHVSGLAVTRPFFHQLAAFLQGVTAAICLFGLVADDMRQCGLGGFAGEVGDIASPTPEETETPNCFRLATTGSHLKNALLPLSHGLSLENHASCIPKFNSTAVGGRYKATGMENLR
jgi:hypothetical protein